MSNHTWKAAVLAGMTMLAGACAQGDDAQLQGAAAVQEAAAAPAANVVEVDAGDFYFRTQRTIPAGLTTIRLSTSNGPEMHHVQLVRIGEGHTVQEFVEAVARGEHAPDWVTFVGGPNAPAPGATSEATMDLEPGEYALVCFIPSADGVPHLMKGMVVPVTVGAATGPAAAEPTADVRMVMNDYSFTFTPELTAGRHTIRVENAAAQPHEVVIAQLAPGKTAQDLLQWIEKPQGPPPGKPVGGTTFITQGEVNFLTADFAPGEYALLCFVPDAKDGKPHVAHGMIRQITVS